MMEWVTRWNDVIAREPELPGVFRRQAGGFRIRARVNDPVRPGKRREVNRILPDDEHPNVTRAREAAAILEGEISKIRSGVVVAAKGRPSFAMWSVEVLERKLASGAISSAAGREKWKAILRLHLIPRFGEYFVDKITRADVESYKANELMALRTHAKDERRARKLEGTRYSPQTANTILGVLRQVMAEASREFDIRDVTTDVDNVSTRGHHTYTYEEPNSLKPGDVAGFLAEMRVRFPEHYAFVFLGFTTGLRPSSLRPLRRRGAQSDIKWDEGKLLVRRSNTKRGEVMDSTKTGRLQILTLDPEQLGVLQWHVDRLQKENDARAKRHPEAAAVQAASDLLFPAAPSRWSYGGGFQSRSCLDKPFRAVAKALGLGYEVSPRAMRRTFQDIARAANMSAAVARAICGHSTEAMQLRYSTVEGPEVRAGLAAVIDIATGRKRAA